MGGMKPGNHVPTTWGEIKVQEKLFLEHQSSRSRSERFLKVLAIFFIVLISSFLLIHLSIYREISSRIFTMLSPSLFNKVPWQRKKRLQQQSWINNIHRKKKLLLGNQHKQLEIEHFPKYFVSQFEYASCQVRRRPWLPCHENDKRQEVRSHCRQLTLLSPLTLARELYAWSWCP